jgi:hypothetical protein
MLRCESPQPPDRLRDRVARQVVVADLEALATRHALHPQKLVVVPFLGLELPAKLTDEIAELGRLRRVGHGHVARQLWCVDRPPAQISRVRLEVVTGGALLLALTRMKRATAELPRERTA